MSYSSISQIRPVRLPAPLIFSKIKRTPPISLENTPSSPYDIDARKSDPLNKLHGITVEVLPGLGMGVFYWTSHAGGPRLRPDTLPGPPAPSTLRHARTIMTQHDAGMTSPPQTRSPEGQLQRGSARAASPATPRGARQRHPRPHSGSERPRDTTLPSPPPARSSASSSSPAGGRSESGRDQSPPRNRGREQRFRALPEEAAGFWGPRCSKPRRSPGPAPPPGTNSAQPARPLPARPCSTARAPLGEAAPASG